MVKLSIRADEVNFAIYRYLVENGYAHTAYTFRQEASLANFNPGTTAASRNRTQRQAFPAHCLITLIHKAMMYLWLEYHTDTASGQLAECDGSFSLFRPHACAKPGRGEVAATGGSGGGQAPRRRQAATVETVESEGHEGAPSVPAVAVGRAASRAGGKKDKSGIAMSAGVAAGVDEASLPDPFMSPEPGPTVPLPEPQPLATNVPENVTAAVETGTHSVVVLDPHLGQDEVDRMKTVVNNMKFAMTIEGHTAVFYTSHNGADWSCLNAFKIPRGARLRRISWHHAFAYCAVFWLTTPENTGNIEVYVYDSETHSMIRSKMDDDAKLISVDGLGWDESKLVALQAHVRTRRGSYSLVMSYDTEKGMWMGV